MGGYAKQPNSIHQQTSHQEQVRRLWQKKDPDQVEGFILETATVKAWPPQIALTCQLWGVCLYLVSGGPVTVTFNVIRQDPPLDPPEPNPWTIHTFSGIGAGLVYMVEGSSMDYGKPCDMDPGDVYYPEITAGSGGGITAGFIVRP